MNYPHFAVSVPAEVREVLLKETESLNIRTETGG
jgi:hypothetical protein